MPMPGKETPQNNDQKNRKGNGFATTPLVEQSRRLIGEIYHVSERIFTTITCLAQRSGNTTCLIAELLNIGHFNREELFCSMHHTELIEDNIDGVHFLTFMHQNVQPAAIERSFALTVPNRTLLSCYAFDTETKQVRVLIRTSTAQEQGEKIQTSYVVEKIGNNIHLSVYQKKDGITNTLIFSTKSEELGRLDETQLSFLYATYSDIQVLDASMTILQTRIRQ